MEDVKVFDVEVEVQEAREGFIDEIKSGRK